ASGIAGGAGTERLDLSRACEFGSPRAGASNGAEPIPAGVGADDAHRRIHGQHVSRYQSRRQLRAQLSKSRAMVCVRSAARLAMALPCLPPANGFARAGDAGATRVDSLDTTLLNTMKQA